MKNSSYQYVMMVVSCFPFGVKLKLFYKTNILHTHDEKKYSVKNVNSHCCVVERKRLTYLASRLND